MTDPGDIWQRYDAKVVQIKQLEARLVELEKEVQTARHERDHWARVGRQLSKKLQVARALAERLREAQHVAAPSTQRPAELQGKAGGDVAGLRVEFDRAREVLGLVLTALTKALDDDDESVAELGRRLRHHAGGKLLYSITRGSLTLVPVDGRYLVDRTWLGRLDLGALRSELDVAAQSGVYPMPEDVSLVHTQPGRAYQRPPSGEPLRFAPPASAPPQPSVESDLDELQVELEGEDDDAYGEDLPPPPPLPAAGFVGAPPPLIGALPAEDEAVHPPARVEPRRAEPVRVEPPRTEPPRVDAAARTDGTRSEDTVRATTRPLHELIPNLRIGRLVKTPGGG